MPKVPKPVSSGAKAQGHPAQVCLLYQPYLNLLLGLPSLLGKCACGISGQCLPLPRMLIGLFLDVKPFIPLLQKVFPKPDRGDHSLCPDGGAVAKEY